MFRTTTSNRLPVWPILVSSILLVASLHPGYLLANELIRVRSNDDVIEKITVGFTGTTRLGHWTPLSFEWSAQGPPGERPTRFELACLDGEGTPVIYRGELDFDPGHPTIAQAWFRLGRISSEIDVGLFSADGNEYYSARLVPNEDFTISPSTTKTILVIEPQDRLQKIIATASENVGGDRVVVSVNSMAQLPFNALGYEGVDKVYLSTVESGWIQQISNMQIEALAQWIQNGGHLIFAAGQGGDSLIGEKGPLARFCPATCLSVGQLDSTSRLQFFSDSDSMLGEDGGKLAVSNVEDVRGIVRLVQDGKPIIIDSADGFGTITFAAIDIGTETFLDWSGNSRFVRKLLFGELEQSASESNNMTGGRVSHYGYDDITGQLRVPLDQFSRVRFVSFTWVAVLIGLYILCIGPGDYFLLKKVVGRMELTWVTFGLITLAFCAIAWFVASRAKPDHIQINQLEIVDIDAESGLTRGFVWANLFSPSTTTRNVALEPSNRLGNQLETRLLSWQGLPGSGLGGMQSSSNTSLITEEYVIEVETRPAGVTTTLEGFPLRVSSSKPVFGRWSATDSVRPQSSLHFNERIQQLDGTFTNPFEFPLRNCRLMFENWVYVIDRDVEPGETIDVLTETREKNVRSYFTRRVSKDDKGTNSAWDPTDTKTSRIADMMMFYDAAGGQGYVGLSHSYHSVMDLSRIPHLNRAILVGEIEEQTTEITLNGESTSDEYDRKLTLLRIVLPVERGNNRRR